MTDFSEKRIVLFGNYDGIASSISALGPIRPVALVGAQNRRRQAELVREMGEQQQIPYLTQSFRRKKEDYEEFVSALVSLNPDLIISNTYSMILEPRILKAARIGAVNLHGGKLPEYRGANTLNWSIANGEPDVYMTLHFMDEGIDTGDIIDERRIPVSETDTARTLGARQVTAAEELLTRNLPRLLSDLKIGKPQTEIGARSWRRRKPSDGDIDWSRSAEEIFNLIRSVVNPWPGARYTDQDGNVQVIDEWISIDEVKAMKSRLQIAAVEGRSTAE
jgi:methionyl-tRNA formyltransferase